MSEHKDLLELYAFLLQWALSSVEAKVAEKPPTTGPGRRGGGKAGRKPARDESWDSSAQIQIAMEVMCKVLKLKLSKLFVTTSDRDTFVNLFTRSIYLILESEQRVKSMSIRMHAFKVLCIAVKHHGHAFGRFYNECSLVVKRLTLYQGPRHPLYRVLHILSIFRTRWLNFCISWRSSMTILSSLTRF